MKNKLSVGWLIGLVVVPFMALLVLDWCGLVCLGRGAGFLYLGYFALVMFLWTRAKIRGLMVGAMIGSLLLAQAQAQEKPKPKLTLLEVCIAIVVIAPPAYVVYKICTYKHPAMQQPPPRPPQNPPVTRTNRPAKPPKKQLAVTGTNGVVAYDVARFGMTESYSGQPSVIHTYWVAQFGVSSNLTHWQARYLTGYVSDYGTILSYSRNGSTENTYWLSSEQPSLPPEDEADKLFVSIAGR